MRAARSRGPTKCDFFRACLVGSTAVVEAGLAARIDPNVLAYHGASALFIAARGDQAEVARLLIDANANANAAERLSGGTALFAAAQLGHVRVATVLLDAGAAPDLAIASGTSPLSMAAANKDRAMMHLLLAAKADASPALVNACAYSNLCAVRVLLAAKADTERRTDDLDACTALHVAASGPNAAVVGAMLAAGARPDALDAHGATPLHVACVNADVATVVALLRARADVCQRLPDGSTALMAAAIHNRLDTVRALVRHANADSQTRNKNGLVLVAVDAHPDGAALAAWLRRHRCACGMHARKTCGRCRAVKYCSAMCQRIDWTAGHRATCVYRDPGVQ